MNISSIVFFTVAFMTSLFCPAEKINKAETSLENPASLNNEAADSPDFISVEKAGIVGDGTTDVTDKLQQLFDKYDTVYFPKGNYLITKKLSSKSGQVIYGNGTAAIVSKSTNPFNFIEVRSKENVQIKNVNFIAPDNTQSPDYAVRIFNSKGVHITNVRGTNAGLVAATGFEGVDYKSINDYKSGDRTTGSSDVVIDNCTGTGSVPATKATRGIWFEYVNNWKISNSSFKNYVQGVQWWGGDSNPEKNGDTSNERKTKNGTVESVTATNIAGGGIWGSMGENIMVKKCNVSNCGDVGIDFEGCFNSSAINNTVKDCKNGCLATFHYNKNISFDNNVISQSDPASPLACIFNSSQKQDNAAISFTNNNFSAGKGTGVIVQQGPSNNILFEKNTLTNVVLNLAFNNNKIIEIKNNTIKLTRTIDKYDFIIKAGLTNNNGKLTVESNKIISTVKQSPDIYAINPFQADYNSSPVNIIKNNDITGITNKYKVEWNGANRGVTSKTFIYSSTKLSSQEIKLVNSKGAQSEVYLNDKKQ